MSENRFAIPGTTYAFEFAPSASGRAQGSRSFTDQTETGVFERVEPFTPSSAELRS